MGQYLSASLFMLSCGTDWSKMLRSWRQTCRQAGRWNKTCEARLAHLAVLSAQYVLSWVNSARRTSCCRTSEWFKSFSRSQEGQGCTSLVFGWLLECTCIKIISQWKKPSCEIFFFFFNQFKYLYPCVHGIVGSIMLCRQSKRISRLWVNWRRGWKLNRKLVPLLRNSSQTKRSAKSSRRPRQPGQ